MRLITARLINVCQHRNLKVDFPPGLTIICGPNGAGKSNLMNLIRASITNDFRSMGGVKENNICRDAEEDEVSYVETVWHTSNGELTLRRFLRGGKSSVSLGSEVLASGKEDVVTTKALDVMGVTSAIVNDFLFASQDRLQDAVGGTKATRAELFQSLCGLDRIEHLDRMLRDKVNQLVGIAGEFDQSELDQKSLIWSAKLEEYKKLKQNYEKYTATKDGSSSKIDYYKSKIKEIDTLVAAYDKKQELAANKIKIYDRTRKAKDRLTELSDKLEKLQKENKDLAVTLEKLKLDFDKSKQQINEINNLTPISELEKLRDKASLPAIPKPDTIRYEKEVQLKASKKIAYITAQINELNLKINNAKELNSAECPTCGAPTDSVKNRIAQWEKEIDQIIDKLAVLKDYEKKITESNRVWEDYESKQNERNIIIAQAREALVACDDTPEQALLRKLDLTEITKKYADVKLKLTQLSAMYKSNQVQIDSTANDLACVKADINSFKREYEENQQKQDELPDEVSKLNYKKVAELTESKHELELKLKKIEETYYELKTAKAIIKSLFVDLRKLKEKRRRVKNLRNFIEITKETRAILSRDRLPARIVGNMLQQTCEKINHYLKAFSMPFIVSVDPKEYAFNAIHTDGSVEPSSRLSVGQKVALAIAFWLARSAVFVGRIPFFCLDEPTAHLDEERVLQCADVFSRLSTELSSTDRQGIIITHHQSLASVATNFIYLKDRYSS
jgi:DNA repair protein SbcC/Rad50